MRLSLLQPAHAAWRGLGRDGHHRQQAVPPPDGEPVGARLQAHQVGQVHALQAQELAVRQIQAAAELQHDIRQPEKCFAG